LRRNYMGIFIPDKGEVDKRWDERIIEAMAQALETDDFSETWCRAAAQARYEEILANARRIERAEAERRLKAKPRERDYKEMAEYAEWKYGHDPGTIIKTLRTADELSYRLLQEAKKLQNGGSHGPAS
jgi:hypothetical protein